MLLWAVVIALVLLAVAYFIYKVVAEVIEDEHVFLIICGGFLIVLITAAFGLHYLIPKPGSADVGKMVKTWVMPNTQSGGLEL